MIKMVDKQTIICKHRAEGVSQREIARQMGLSRGTVHKVVAEYEAALRGPDPDTALESVLTTPPKYAGGPRERRVMTAQIRALIDEQLENNARKRATGLRKQCVRMIDIWEMLSGRGFSVSYPAVCKYAASVSRKKLETKAHDAFIRGHYPPGESCEFDWGEVKLLIDGHLERLYMAAFTLCHSNGRWAWLFRHQNTLAFMESHRNFFRHVRGAPQVMVYDNMRVAVKEFTGVDKKPTEAMLRLSSFYRFHYRFCNARAGWEKGHVVRSVELVRRKAFSLEMRYNSLSDAQKHLMETCEKLNARNGSIHTPEKAKSIAADLAALTPCVYDMGCFEQERYKVDKWATICMKGSHYSVPDTLVGKTVEVRIYSEKIAIFHGAEKVATHQRIHRSGGWSVDIDHYLTTLLRKPGAVGSSVALRQMPAKIRSIFEGHFTDCPKDFVLLLQYAREHGFSHDDIAGAASALRSRGMKALSIDRLKVMLHRGAEAETPATDALSRHIAPSLRRQHSQIERQATQTLADISLMMNRQAQSR